MPQALEPTTPKSRRLLRVTVAIALGVASAGLGPTSEAAPKTAVAPTAPTALIGVSNRSFTVTGTPRIHGQMRVGATVQVVGRLPVFSPTPTSWSYQWFRGNWAIPGATDIRYTLRPGDIERDISVRVTAMRSGHNNRSVRTPARFVPDIAEISTRIFVHTNIEREIAGLPAFNANGTLNTLARRKSADMARTGNLSHTASDGLQIWDWMRSAGFPFAAAAENIGWTSPGRETADQAAARVVQMWMNSPSHRANILNPTMTTLGVGTAIANNGRLFYTQAFSG